MKLNNIKIVIQFQQNHISFQSIDSYGNKSSIEIIKGIELYPYSLIIDKNEIQIFENQKDENKEVSFQNNQFMNDIFNKITINKKETNFHRFNYQSQTYQLTNDSLLILFLYQFKRIIDQKGIITETIVFSNCFTSLYSILRIYTCLNTVGFNNIHIHSQHTKYIQFTTEMISDQYEELIEISQKWEKYLKFKRKIERMQCIMKETNDTKHLDLLHLNINESFSLTKMKEIKKSLTCKERSKYHLCHLDYYTIFISSRYFETFDDYVHLEMSSKRLIGNMEKFHYNPISLTQSIVDHFPNVQTLNLYSTEDEILQNKSQNIHYCCIWYPVDYFQYEILKNSLSQQNLSLECKHITYTQQDRFIAKIQRKQIDLPENIHVLGSYCYRRCHDIKSIVIPSSITKIEKGCFELCSSITSLSFSYPWSVEGNILFNNRTELASISLPISISMINGEQRPKGILREYRIPNHVLRIDKYCFDNCAMLLSLSIPSSVTYIPHHCLLNCSSLKTIQFENNWYLEGRYLFNTSNELCSVQLPTQMKTYQSQEILPLITFTIPSYVTKISDYCFAHCNDLTRIEISDKIKSIGKGCFMDCDLVDYKTNSKIVESFEKQLLLTKTQRHQIEDWCDKEIDMIIFDSDIDNWSMRTSTFDEKLKERQHIVILIETEMNYPSTKKNEQKDNYENKTILFGCYIDAKIQRSEMNDDKWINDPNAFIFTINSDKMIKCPIKQSEQQYAFLLCPKYSDGLCLIGKNDIPIPKDFSFSSCFQYEDSTYDYEGKENVILGKCGDFIWKPKRILAIQMKTKPFHYFKSSQFPYLSQLLQGSFEYSLSTLQFKWKYGKELLYISKWTGKTFKEIVFDSSIDTINHYETDFQNKVLNRKNLVFLIQSKDNDLFGEYLSQPIHHYGENAWVEDENAFVFSFKDDQPNKYSIKKERKHLAFKLYSKYAHGLFSFGFYDVFIRKFHQTSNFYQGNDNTFDYKGKLCPLVGKIGFGTSFVIDHIWVIELI